MSLDGKINAFLKSKEGKQKVAEAKAKALKEGRTFGQPGTSINKDDAKEAAERMKTILTGKLAEAHLEELAASGIIIGEPVVDKDGNISVDISFDEDMLHRDSLWPENPEYSKGIENIVVHLTHGWDADGRVYGYWARAGGVIRSASHMDGNSFMQQAVEDFNALGLGTAELNEKYL
jgi:hypothetical protein